ncbi:hypothetical protein MYX04_14035, partial [Nitrospiraceae bacterium AH_259_D15_M11_P09]|nr:hypothetical protein [Nitrospiraceae bacterium AH_259_D15_M11_P09]
AELGPMDPQITTFNPFEKRMEEFSPLHIDSTFELIREEYKNGNDKLADKLMEKLQFPLTLGGYKKSLDISKQYLEKLLSTRMLKDDIPKAKGVAKRLTEGYADHGFCINAQEAAQIGLKVDVLDPRERGVIWNIQKLALKKSNIEAEKRKKEMQKKIKDLPPDILDKLTDRTRPS